MVTDEVIQLIRSQLRIGVSMGSIKEQLRYQHRMDENAIEDALDVALCLGQYKEPNQEESKPAITGFYNMSSSAGGLTGLFKGLGKTKSSLNKTNTKTLHYNQLRLENEANGSGSGPVRRPKGMKGRRNYSPRELDQMREEIRRRRKSKNHYLANTQKLMFLAGSAVVLALWMIFSYQTPKTAELLDRVPTGFMEQDWKELPIIQTFEPDNNISVSRSKNKFLRFSWNPPLLNKNDQLHSYIVTVWKGQQAGPSKTFKTPTPSLKIDLFKPGQYYWSVRYITADGRQSSNSPIFSLRILN